MYSNPQYDSADAFEDGLTREKIIQAFSILGIPIGDENYNHRGEVIDAMSLDELSSPKYWNDRKPAPPRSIKEPLYTPEYVEDETLATVIEPKTDWDMPRNGIV